MTELLDELRPAAFAIAYRMLGSVAEAEDIVQETLLRFHRASAGDEPISSPRAYVVTIATRLAIDELRSARVRREAYVGEWLPEPVIGRDQPARAAAAGLAADPHERTELAESLSLAFLVLLETLSPEQRAVLLLRDVFDYGYDEIGAIVGKTPDNTRQLAARARGHVAAGRPRFEASREQHDELALRFFAAAEEGDLAGLEALLAEDVVLHGDGGGQVPALARSLHGRGRVARTLVAWSRAGARIAGASLRPVAVNGQPGALMLDAEGRLISVMALDIVAGRIQGVNSIVNPDKLRHIGPVADFAGLLGRRAP